jgi:hypothetical protein
MTSKHCNRYLETGRLCARGCLHCLVLRWKLRDKTGSAEALPARETAQSL